MSNDDLTEDDFAAFEAASAKRGAAPAKRTAKQKAAAVKAQEARDLALAQNAKADAAKRVAQIANLVIAGYSFEQIGADIGATADEVERMLMSDTARYVRTQPSLRIFVRNYLSSKYNDLLEAVWDQATDPSHTEKLENQDRAIKVLDRLAKLHGAEAPIQSEVKVDAAPEAVERMVAALATGRGQGYNIDVFDTIPGEVVHEAAQAGRLEVERSGEAVGEPQEDDESF